MNTIPGPLLLTGVTGNTGAQALRSLAGSGVPLRGMVRRTTDAAKLPPGVEPVVADFDDPDSIAAALDGVWRAYLVTPSSERAGRQQVDFVDAAAKTGLDRVVLLSQLGARRESPVRYLRYHAVVEEHVRDVGLDYTFLRPNLYFQGFFALAPQIRRTGIVSAPIGDAAVSAIDVRDIGDCVAAELLTPQRDHATYTLTGPRALTHAQIAEALGAATGQPVRFVDVAPDAFADAMADVMPDWQLGGLLEDYAHYRRGEAAEVTGAVRDLTGHEPHDVTEFARDFAEKFTREVRMA